MLNRRAVLAGLAAAGVSSCASQPFRPAPRSPDVIVILADDLGFSDLGCYGSEIATPNLDRLAASGVRFTRFYNASKCYSTRAALLSGLHHHEVGLGGRISRVDEPIAPGPYQGFIDPSVPILPEYLRAQGYRTYHSGKWHVGERPQHWPLTRGFDRSFALISGATSYYEVTQEEGRFRQMTLDDQPWTPPPEDFYATDAYADFAAGCVRDHVAAHAASPYFLYLAFTAPHWPLHVPEALVARSLARYEAGWDAVRRQRFDGLRAAGVTDARYRWTERPADIPAWADRTDEAWARRMAVYSAMIEAMDAGIGRLIAEVERAGRLNDTLLLFLSDNGASHEDITGRGLHDPAVAIGARGSFQNIRAPWAWAANAPFRGSKEGMFEGGVNTCAIAHWPARIAAPGRVERSVAHVVDIAPTALAAAGAPPLARPRGRDLGAVFDGATPGAREEPLFFEIFTARAWMDGPWKACRQRGASAWELYNLEDDPCEAVDLASRERPRLDRMAAAWRAEAERIGVRRIDP